MASAGKDFMNPRQTRLATAKIGIISEPAKPFREFYKSVSKN
jgi:hypothetical protein